MSNRFVSYFYKYFLPIWILVIVVGILSVIYGCAEQPMNEETNNCIVQEYYTCKMLICDE